MKRHHSADFINSFNLSNMNHTERSGNFTSSGIAALTSLNAKKDGFGKPALTYIEEKRIERLLQLPLNTEASARPMIWGQFNEKRVFDLIGISYRECSQETIKHPSIDYWSGSPDGTKDEDGMLIVCDVKCPYTRKSFAMLAEGCNKNSMEYIRENHSDGDKYYWQLVSNAILTGATHAELIVYMPYLSELRDIRDAAANYEGDQNKVAWIGFAGDDDLPYIKDGGYFKNLNKIRFEVPQADKDFLTEKVIAAGKLLLAE